MVKNSYVVTFDTKKGGLQSWILHVEAPTRLTAIAKCREMWESDPNLSDMYQWNMTVRRMLPTEEFAWHYFHKFNWEDLCNPRI